MIIVNDSKNPRFVMRYQGRVHEADTLDALVDVLQPGYSDIPKWFPNDVAEKSLEARSIIATQHIPFLREIYLANALDEAGVEYGQWMYDDDGVLKMAQAAEDNGLAPYSQLVQYLSTNPVFPVLAGEKWDYKVRLVLLANAYVSHEVEMSPPTGNVIIINPLTDLTLLQTMQEVGVIEFYVLAPGDAKEFEGEDEEDKEDEEDEGVF
ncbi:MAG: hypothetical protein LBC29_04360 [Propionibacteriaceae bacterium]|jgi:hypothetical protein|nr:hypothetical protein [Propionibacteriaceae bacterium]